MNFRRSTVSAVVAAALLAGVAAFALLAGGGHDPSRLQLAGSESLGHTASSDDSTISTTPGVSTPSTVGSSGSSTSTTIPDTAPDATVPSSTVAGSETRVLDAAGAGTVTYAVDFGSGGADFRLIDAVPSEGWTMEIEQAAGSEIEVDFRSGTQRVQVDVELEDGSVRERVRVRDDADDSETRFENGEVARHELGDDDPDDDSGSGSGDNSDDDHSDDDHSDDDHSDDD